MSQSQRGTNGLLPNMTKERLEANIQRIVERDRAARGLGADEVVISRKATPEELEAIRRREFARPMDRVLEQPIRRPTKEPETMPKTAQLRSPFEARITSPTLTRVQPATPVLVAAADPPAPAFVNRSRDHLISERPAPEPALIDAGPEPEPAEPEPEPQVVIQDAEPEPVIVSSHLDDLLAQGFVEAPGRTLLGYGPMVSIASKGDLTLSKAATERFGRWSFAKVLVDVPGRRLAIVRQESAEGSRPIHAQPSGTIKVSARNAMRLFDPPIVAGKCRVTELAEGYVMVACGDGPIRPAGVQS